MAAGTKLVLNLPLSPTGTLYLRPEGRSWNSPYRGWDLSPKMEPVRRYCCVLYRASRLSWGSPIILLAHYLAQWFAALQGQLAKPCDHIKGDDRLNKGTVEHLH